MAKRATTSRTPSPRTTTRGGRVASSFLLPQVEQAVATAAVSPSHVPTTPSFSFSPYPDLALAISMLNSRAGQVNGERRVLVEKWVAQLNRVQTEMTRLRKLEKLAESLSQPKQEDLPL